MALSCLGAGSCVDFVDVIADRMLGQFIRVWHSQQRVLIKGQLEMELARAGAAVSWPRSGA